MRIAIIHEAWGAGAARCAQDLRRELSKTHEVCYFPRTSEPETPEAIHSELQKFRPDVVNCHSFYGNLPYDFLPALSRLYRTCFTAHDPRPIGTLQPECWACEYNATCRHCPLVGSGWRQWLRNPYYQQRKIKRQAHGRCAPNMRIVAPSRWMLERLRAQELSRFRAQLIPYGIDLEFFGKASDSRSAFGLPGAQPIILFSAWYESRRNLGRRKGLADLAEAFETRIIPAIPNAILAVAGEAFVPNHPNVRPLGMVSLANLPQLLSAADVYVLPTLADNLPYSVLEAMGCAVPIVATNVGGIPEQVLQGETGLLVPPGQPDQLAEAIISTLSDPEKAKAMAAGGRRRAEALFGMEGSVRAYERLFEEMMSEPAILGRV